MKPKSIKFVRMTIAEANKRLLFQLYHIYSTSEAANIADLVMENITGWKRIDRIVNANVGLSLAIEELFNECISKLSAHVPVQYVLHEAWFYGLKFFVDENVLIPRPETEELTAWCISHTRSRNLKILDIGTGSGCIAISIKKNSPGTEVFANDISNAALEVAKRNAQIHKVPVSFIIGNISDANEWEKFSDVDVIISNPPYIPESERSSMHENVLRYEPHLALFVKDRDAMYFYRTIAMFGKKKLIPGGEIFVEIHEDRSSEVEMVFKEAGYNTIEIKKDMQGKNRMIRVS